MVRNTEETGVMHVHETDRQIGAHFSRCIAGDYERPTNTTSKASPDLTPNFFGSVPADCIDTVVSTRGDTILYQKMLTPRPHPKVVLKNAWPEQHDKEVQQQSSTEQSCGEGDPFKIDPFVPPFRDRCCAACITQLSEVSDTFCGDRLLMCVSCSQ